MHKSISAEEMEEIIQEVIENVGIEDDPEAAEAFFEEQWTKMEAFHQEHKLLMKRAPLAVGPG